MQNTISAISIIAYLGIFYNIVAPPSAQPKQITPQVQQDKRLTTLHELFTTLGIKVAPTYEAMNSFAQMYWLRGLNKERWEIENSISFELKADKIIRVLKKLGMIDRIDPSINKPDYALVLGSTVYRMRTRMQHLIELINARTFSPKQIVVLTGDRPLDPTQEPESLLLDKTFIRSDWQRLTPLPTNESEAARLVWDQLQKPDSIKNIPVIFVATPMLKKNGKLVRPTTENTIATWLKLSPKSGSIVAFSNNPYIPFQQEAIKPKLIKAGWFKHKGTLEAVGTGFTYKDGDKKVSNLLDNVARYIYSILQVEKALAEEK